MKKISILYCIEFLVYGGTEKQLYSLIEGLDKKKFKPHLCCMRKSIIGETRKREASHLFDQINCNKLQLDFVSFKKLHSLFEISKLLNFIKKNNIIRFVRLQPVVPHPI